MTTLREVARLRYRLKDDWRLAPYGQGHVALCADGRRFGLHPWQYTMLCALDGTSTFREAAQLAHETAGGFTPQGLLNFYHWLNDEDLVFCLCDSVFELADSPEPSPVRQAPPTARPPAELAASGAPQPSPEGGEFRSIWKTFLSDMERCADRVIPSTPAQWRIAKVAATVLFSLAVLRLAFVAAPVFEPPVNYAYAGLERWLAEGADDPAVSIAKSETGPERSPVKEIAVAGRADAAGMGPGGDLQAEAPVASRGAGDRNGDAEAAVLEAEEAARLARKRDDLERIEVLRQMLSSCRVRRDEYYLQSNEAGYREEVEKMTEITREIGEIEARL